MKNNIFRTLLTLAFAIFTLPMLSQDFMNIYFKNGDFRKFYMKNITEIAASKVDAEGVQHSDYCYQRITTIYDTYIYSLEDVDSITFTKIDEEKAEHNFVTAMPEVFSAIDGCETIEDVEEKIDQIKNAEGVADAWSDGHMLHVTIAEGETFSFHFNHDIDDDLSSIKNGTSEVRSLLPRMEAIKQKNQKLKVVIANQQDKDEKKATHKTSIFYQLRDDLEKCGITAIYEENPSVEFFYNNSDDPKHLNVYDYDIVILSTHGSYDYNPQYINGELSYTKKIHSFATSDSFIFDHGVDRPGWVDNYPAFKDWRDKTRFRDATDAQINYGFYSEVRNNKEVWVAHPELTELFFSDFAKGRFHNKKSILFNCACESLKGNNYSFADALFAHDLGVYMGYTEINRFGQRASFFLLEGMLQGASVETVKEGFPEYCTYETLENVMKRPGDFSADNLEEIKKEGLFQARLEILPQNNDDILNLFLLPPYSEQIDQKIANEEYNESQTVTVKGSASILNFDPDNVKAGFTLSCFEYGQNPIGATQFIKAEIVPVNYKSKIDFSAKLKNLERGKTYQYRAYTYDGKHYNYGDICSFTIDGGTTPRPDIKLTPGTIFITRTKEDVEVTYTVITNDRNNDKYTCKIENGSNTGQGGIRLRRANGAIVPAIAPDTEGIVTIPESAAGFSVTEVGTNAFLDCGKVTAINLPETIEEIGESAMSGCVGLSSITIPKIVKTISRNAFGGCKNVKIIYAEMVTPFAINENVFQTAAEEQSGTASSIFANATLYVPVGSKNQYAITPGWNRFQRINEYTPGGDNPDPGPGGDIIAYTSCPDDHHPHLIDLGLPSGTKWACCNVGASKPETRGEEYAWGETEYKNYCSLENYTLCPNGDVNSFPFYGDIAGTEYDVAHVKWGGKWQIPSMEHLKELVNVCSSEWTQNNGVNGRFFTGPNGGKIFLPAETNWGEYWSSNQITYGKCYSYTLEFDCYFAFDPDSRSSECYWGRLIRPIILSDDNVPTTDDSIISFADPKVKAVCVARWDTNGDGELSKAEASAVTSLDDAFKNNKDGITSFNELQYFTNLTSLGMGFSNCQSLISIIIPNSVLSFGAESFFCCRDLVSINIPNRVSSIRRAFVGCGSLTSITIPKSVKKISERAFQNCSKLKQVHSYIEEPFTIDSSVFDGIPDDATLYVPAGCKAKYEATEGWNKFKNIVEME